MERVGAEAVAVAEEEEAAAAEEEEEGGAAVPAASAVRERFMFRDRRCRADDEPLARPTERTGAATPTGRECNVIFQRYTTSGDARDPALQFDDARTKSLLRWEAVFVLSVLARGLNLTRYWAGGGGGGKRGGDSKRHHD